MFFQISFLVIERRVGISVVLRSGLIFGRSRLFFGRARHLCDGRSIAACGSYHAGSGYRSGLTASGGRRSIISEKATDRHKAGRCDKRNDHHQSNKPIFFHSIPPLNIDYSFFGAAASSTKAIASTPTNFLFSTRPWPAAQRSISIFAYLTALPDLILKRTGTGS